MKKSKFNLRNFFGHLKTVNKHRFKVFLLCCKVGIPFQGLVHDLSKYSPIEFLEGVKYFQGTYSPIKNCKMEIGYSPAWLHHKGRNKHHYDYWYDFNAPENTPVIPFKYFLEMVCDTLAAGMVYQGNNWTQDYQLSYWLKEKDKVLVNQKIKDLLEKVYTDISVKGLNPVLNKKYLKKLYDKYTK